MSKARLGVSRTMDGVRLRLGSLTLDLASAEAKQLHEEIGRALMPGQPPAPPHECSHPLQPPHGSFFAPGPCLTCGKTWALAQAEWQAAAAMAALAAAREASRHA